MRKLPLILATAAIGVFAAGCGGDDEDTASAPTAPSPSETTPAQSEPPASPGSGEGDTVQVGMKALQFDPKEISVKVGQKIVWTNNESIPHNVVAEQGADFESDVFGEGKTFEYTPDKAGTIAYVCTLHPGMDGEITVTE